MFNTRLLRDDVALHAFRTMASLVRRLGQPDVWDIEPYRPRRFQDYRRGRYSGHNQSSASSHLTGFEALRPRPRHDKNVSGWAQDSFAQIIAAVRPPALNWRLIPEAEQAQSPATDRALGDVFYGPQHCQSAGLFLTHVLLAIGRHIAFDPTLPELSHLGEDDEAEIVSALAGCAYLGQAMPLLKHAAELDRVTHDAAGAKDRRTKVSVETHLIFMSALVLSIHNQPPQKIIITLGHYINRARAEKVYRACRQIESYSAELKLIRFMNARTGSEARGPMRTASEPHFFQPQRISWI